MARPALSHEEVSRFSPPKPENFDDLWPEEPTAVDAAMTMEELIVDELRRQGSVPAPAQDSGKSAKKGTQAG
jgi:hypothetical protein